MPIAVLIAFAAPRYIAESERHPGKFDLPGALTSTLGLVGLVYGFIRAASDGWTDPVTLGSFIGGVVLVAAFVIIETRTAQPITPLKLFANRNRTGGLVMMLCLAAAMFGIFFYITLFVQGPLDYSPLKAGFAFMPISASIIVAAQLASSLQAKYGPKPFMAGGALLVTVGLTWLTFMNADSGYVDGILGPTVIFGFGMGLVFVPVMLLAVAGVSGQETGAASGLLNSMQQIGGSLGLSILTTVFAHYATAEAKIQLPGFMATATPEQKAWLLEKQEFPKGTGAANEVLAQGISHGFIVGAVMAGLAFVIAVVAIKAKASDLPSDTAGCRRALTRSPTSGAHPGGPHLRRHDTGPVGSSTLPTGPSCVPRRTGRQEDRKTGEQEDRSHRDRPRRSALEGVVAAHAHPVAGVLPVRQVVGQRPLGEDRPGPRLGQAGGVPGRGAVRPQVERHQVQGARPVVAGQPVQGRHGVR